MPSLNSEPATSSGNANENRYIRASYSLYDVTDGGMELVERTTLDHPFFFISGLGIMLQDFEDQLTPLKAGDNFDFTLTPAEAYGDHQPELVQTLDKEMFTVDGKFDYMRVKPGNTVPLLTEDGQRVEAQVTAVGPDTVTIDLNHPLAGRDLRFFGTVAVNRPATNVEISDFLASTDDTEE